MLELLSHKLGRIRPILTQPRPVNKKNTRNNEIPRGFIESETKKYMSLGFFVKLWHQAFT